MRTGLDVEGGQGDFPPGLTLTLTDTSQGMVDEALAGSANRMLLPCDRQDGHALPRADDLVRATFRLAHRSRARSRSGARRDEGVLKPGGITCGDDQPITATMPS